MKTIMLCEANAKVEDIQSYIQSKASAQGNNMPSLNRISLLSNESLPFMSSDALPAMERVLSRKVEMGKLCVLDTLKSRFALAEKEMVVEDKFSYLTGEFMGHSPGTVVLTRTTNLATWQIILADVQLELQRDSGSVNQFVSILEADTPLYPIPPSGPVEIQNLSSARLAAADSYVLTSVKPAEKTKISFGWEMTQKPGDASAWWGLYQGVMPSWDNLRQWNNWDWITTKGTDYGKSGSKTVDVSGMVSGAIYTFALFINGSAFRNGNYDLVDKQEFTARW